MWLRLKSWSTRWSWAVWQADASTWAMPTTMSCWAVALWQVAFWHDTTSIHAVGRLSGTTVGKDNKFPNGAHSTFIRNVYELGAQYECHFFAYGTGKGYKDSRRIAPYLLGGVGMTYAPKPADHVFALSIPLGFGVKYKFAERVNVGAEWAMRFTTSDRLDVTSTTGLSLNDPYGIESKGFKNKDCYSLLMLYVSYDMFPKYRKCNN